MKDIFKEVFMSMSNDELIKAIQEIEKAKIDGFYEENSIVRIKSRELKQEFGNTSLDLMFSEVNILRVASLKWLESNKKSVLEKINIKFCGACPFCYSERRYTSDSWESLSTLSCSKSNNKEIADYVDWNEDIEVPSWCPLK